MLASQVLSYLFCLLATAMVSRGMAMSLRAKMIGKANTNPVAQLYDRKPQYNGVG